MTKRCPWCGEKINSTYFNSITEYRCRDCGKKSTVKTNGMIYFIPAAFAVIILLITRSAFASVSLLPLLFISVYGSIKAPLERSPNKFVLTKKAECRITLTENWNIIKTRITFFEDRILLLCFVNEDEQPVSHTLAAAIENIKTEKGQVSFRLSFMPKNSFVDSFPAGTKLFLYDEDIKIADGTLTSDVNYPRFDMAEQPE